MSKVITSPVKRWTGTVTISDPLNYPQALDIEAAISQATALPDGATRRQYNFTLLPAVLGCVERWDLQGLPAQVGVDSFPATPPTSSARLLAWLINEVIALYREADENPNE